MLVCAVSTALMGTCDVGGGLRHLHAVCSCQEVPETPFIRTSPGGLQKAVMPAQGRLLLPGGVWCSRVELYFRALLKVVKSA